MKQETCLRCGKTSDFELDGRKDMPCPRCGAPVRVSKSVGTIGNIGDLAKTKHPITAEAARGQLLIGGAVFLGGCLGVGIFALHEYNKIPSSQSTGYMAFLSVGSLAVGAGLMLQGSIFFIKRATKEAFGYSGPGPIQDEHRYLKTVCGKCDQPIEFPEEDETRETECPGCKSPIVLLHDVPTTHVTEHDTSNHSVWYWRSALATVAISLFGVFVWPTIYRYDHMNVDGTVLPVRINRLTGGPEILYESGWRVPTQPQMYSAPTTVILPAEELVKLKGRATFRSRLFSCEVYNGSTYRVEEITVHIHVDDTGLTRDYRLHDGIMGLGSLENGRFEDLLDFAPQNDAKWSFYIAAAKGKKEE